MKHLGSLAQLTILAMTVLLLSGCNAVLPTATPYPTQTPYPTSTPYPTYTIPMQNTPRPTTPSLATATPRSGLLFEDDFSSEQVSRDRGWLFGPNGAGTLYRTWSPNTYTMRGQSQDVGCKNMYWMDSTLDIFGDFGAEIVAQPISKSAEYGIAFRADGNPRNAQNWYALSVDTMGEYRFRKRINGDYSGKDLVSSTASKDIKPGQERNRLEVLADGSAFSFYINGNLVNTSRDSSFTRGRVGFYLCPFQESNVEVAFSRMTILTVEKARIDLANIGK